jgi:hypothetical protein
LWAQTGLSFSRQDFGLGEAPFSVTIGDFNGDGQQDVATANLQADSVSILLGNGDGTFEPRQDFGVGEHPVAIAVGDFNGDSQQDLATANVNVNTVSILLGNGDGTFEPAQDVEAGLNPESIAVGDFNGDSQQDLATTDIVSGNSGSVSILIGNGDGTFQPAQDVEVGLRPVSITVGDFNGDSQQDLVTANLDVGQEDSVSILLGNGDGTFQPTQGSVLGEHPFSVTVGDFDGDGRQDLATANAAADTVSILLGNGDGTFQPAQDFGLQVCPTLGQGPVSITAGDFNGDGRQDLATANTPVNTAFILLGNGDGTFEPGQAFDTGQGPRSITVGDFNADGAQDVAVAAASSSSVTILINNASAVPPRSAPSPAASGNNGGGAVGPLSLLLLGFLMSANAAYARRRQRTNGRIPPRDSP